MMTVALLAAAVAGAEQKLPPCAELNGFWLSRARPMLKPDWPAVDLDCATPEERLDDDRRRDLAFARAAYVLDATRFRGGGPLLRPLIPGERSPVPPASMLEWLGGRVRTLAFGGDGAWADWDAGKVHIGRGDVFGKPEHCDAGPGEAECRAVALTGQIIHETKHLRRRMDEPSSSYAHGACRLGRTTDHACDPTITESVDAGGSHAVAAYWLAWIARRSRWPEKARRTAEATAAWVVRNRINDRFAASDFSCRYLHADVSDLRRPCLPHEKWD